MMPENQKPDVNELKAKLDSLQEQIKQAEDAQSQTEISQAPMETIFTWEAPERVVTQHSRPWYLVVAIVFLVAILFATLIKEPLLIAALIALMILIFISTTIKPKIVKNEITNKGIRSGNKIWNWGITEGFWLSTRGKHTLLIMNLEEKQVPNRVILLLGAENPKKLVSILVNYLNYVPRKDIGEDIINIFTLGEYVPLSEFIDLEEKEPSRTQPVNTNRNQKPK